MKEYIYEKLLDNTTNLGGGQPSHGGGSPAVDVRGLKQKVTFNKK